MLRSTVCRLVLFLLLVPLCGFAGASPPIAPPSSGGQTPATTLSDSTLFYQLTPVWGSNPHLEIDIVVPASKKVQLQIPTWCPGDYHVQHFARYITHVEAQEDHHLLPTVHSDANSWEVKSDGIHPISISYWVLPQPPGLFSENVQIRQNQVFVSGPAAFLYVVGEKSHQCQLVIHAPHGWRTIVPLTPVELSVEPTYIAQDYDALVDAPILLAPPAHLAIRSFTLLGREHEVVFFNHPEDVVRADVLTQILQRLVQVEDNRMGGPLYLRYIFFFDVEGGGGGLEHRDSARLVYWPQETSAQFAALAAHEFFHLWNVKRIRPRELGPFNYIHPPRTSCLWFAEGVTDYCAWLAILRAGLITPKQFLDHWLQEIKSYLSNPARLLVSASEASLRVWEGGHSDGFGGLSYYQKGALIGLCLDLTLRHITQNRCTIWDVLRLLLQRYAPPNPGYTDADLRAAFNAVAGKDISAVYDRMVHSTQEMPLETCLSYVGLSTTLEPLGSSGLDAMSLRGLWLSSPEGP